MERRTDFAATVALVGSLLLGGTRAFGQDAADETRMTLTGYLETFYSYNFDRPVNNVTAFRGFDNRSDTFTVSNAVADAS